MHNNTEIFINACDLRDLMGWLTGSMLIKWLRL